MGVASLAEADTAWELLKRYLRLLELTIQSWMESITIKQYAVTSVAGLAVGDTAWELL